VNKEINRFFRKVDIVAGSECLVWTGEINNGYGRFLLRGKRVRAHRFIWEHSEGKIQDGMLMDHLCRNRACVNTLHLRVVTPKVNVTENSNSLQAFNKNKTHCINGHPFSAGNTLKRRVDGRLCRECNRNRCKIYRNKNKEA
jgi:hypothetical protein